MAVKPGFIYVLTHPSDPYLIKVGITTRTPHVRLKEHNTQFDKAAGRVVEATGQKWLIKEYFEVEDTYNAESAFWHRPPLTEIPYAFSNELLKLHGSVNWDWVNEGLRLSRSLSVRRNTSQPPKIKSKPKKGAQWIKTQLEGTGLKPLKSYGNGITRVAFKCSKRHVFKIDGRSLVKFPFCPVCQPEQFDTYTLNRIDFGDKK